MHVGNMTTPGGAASQLSNYDTRMIALGGEQCVAPSANWWSEGSMA
jgi:hypothetical protein